MDKIQIQNVNFSNYRIDEFLDIFETRIEKEEKTFVVTANPEIVEYANKDEQYYQTLQKADFITADGIGVVIASKVLKTPLKERVAGFDLMSELLHMAEKKNKKVYLLGAKESTIEKAYKNIKDKHPELNIVGYHHGYIDIEDEELVQSIVRLEPDMIFVALGFPKQEYWIEKHMDKFQKGLFMGVGGSFDVWAGEVKRAPEVWIKLNLEWLYRLLKQPTRFKRMLVLPQFLVKVMVKRK
ncbi:WecB/TagA/CpsF family glycosyltransferase [Pallidibacillus pasinlerensis]|uniref:N-acetylglucosaminyldiphosphoundecaprenol N-acetyl-beta-D-mannosaminyltransferase n=1 Tax=Pallidibacillus pasinlerensis TaxID=2703818 RepID=A0ABX0A2M6_9BACI|nr:WecB/TagA/CpsF family glycosyltransferase [Pallidibacillus pasinlerensis]NCU17689.1 WecB/TagA/CpsF family glycosyltransferase [Pallidibacillus pasinlerensis]